MNPNSPPSNASGKKFLAGIVVSLVLGALVLAVVFKNPTPAPPPVIPAAHGTLIATTTTNVILVATNSAAIADNADGVVITFEKLSGFPFYVTNWTANDTATAQAAAQKTAEQIPDEIKNLDAKKVSLAGFMLPMKYDKDLTTEFLLLKNQSACCYGIMPQITEWVSVRMAKSVAPVMDVPLTVSGTFHVGEERENGTLTSIYQLDGDDVKVPTE